MAFCFGVIRVSSMTPFILLWRGAGMRRKGFAPCNLQHCKLFFQMEPDHIICLLWTSGRGSAVVPAQDGMP